MIAVLTSSLGGSYKVNGRRVPTYLLNENGLAEKINEYDVIVLAGGHVPTQNKFFKKINLKQKLQNFDGMVIAWSAGSMNCAEIVYALPELEGEGINKDYQRFIEGLCITKKMIIPHFQDVREDIVDGLRVIEDMAYPDSIGKEFIALNDGSFIISLDGDETLYGEAFLIRDGKQMQVCKKDEFVQL